MAKTKPSVGQTDQNTEEKIREAARKLFVKKGFKATRTRDIAAEAGINLALLNYYFRSKEKLFEMIMIEHLQHFIKGLANILNDETSTLETKIELLVSNYIDMLSRQPDLPLFLVAELRHNPEFVLEKLPVKEYIIGSHLMKQLMEGIAKGELVQLNPVHFIINFAGLTVFPFIGKPIIQSVGNGDDQAFLTLMQERKKLIPMWIKQMMTGAK